MRLSLESGANFKRDGQGKPSQKGPAKPGQDREGLLGPTGGSAIRVWRAAGVHPPFKDGSDRETHPSLFSHVILRSLPSVVLFFAVREAKRSPKDAKRRQEAPRERQRDAKMGQRARQGGQRAAKGDQGRPKGGQGEAKRGQREAKGRPRGGQERPKGGQRRPKGSQREAQRGPRQPKPPKV